MIDHKIPASPADDMAAELTRLREDFGRLSNSVSELVKSQANSTAETLRSTVASMSGAAADRAADLTSSALQMTDTAQKAALNVSRDVEAAIERNPLTAVMIAAGIGIVLGMASSRA